MHRLLQGIENEAGMRRGADAPADDAARIGINDEGDIDEPFLGGDIGEPKVREAKSDTHSLLGAGARN